MSDTNTTAEATVTTTLPVVIAQLPPCPVWWAVRTETPRLSDWPPRLVRTLHAIRVDRHGQFEPRFAICLRYMTQSLQPASGHELTPDAKWPVWRVAFPWAAWVRAPRTFAGGDRVNLGWDFVTQYAARAQVETAVGVLMELCGWEATQARSRLFSAAASLNAPVEKVAAAILALGPEHPR